MLLGSVAVMASCSWLVGASDLSVEPRPSATDAGQANDASENGSAVVDARSDTADVPGRKKPITFDVSKVRGLLEDFPVWIDIVDAEVAARARADGADLFFTASDGTPLAHEIQRWDRTAGGLGAWVRVPELSNATPTTIYLRYGDATGAPAPAPATAFSASFAAVWHLEDTLSEPIIAEATGTRTGSAVNLAPTQQRPAKLGGGIAFTGGKDEITFENPLSGGGSHTISLWISQSNTTDDDALVVLGAPSCGASRWFHSRFKTNTAAVGFYCNDWPSPKVDIQDAGFTLLHWVYEGTKQTSSIYRDGVLVAGPFSQIANSIATTGTAGHIGNAPIQWGSNMGAHATLDEVRIATVARSAEWIATEFANQSSPSTFYAVGPEEPN